MENLAVPEPKLGRPPGAAPVPSHTRPRGTRPHPSPDSRPKGRRDFARRVHIDHFQSHLRFPSSLSYHAEPPTLSSRPIPVLRRREPAIARAAVVASFWSTELLFFLGPPASHSPALRLVPRAPEPCDIITRSFYQYGPMIARSTTNPLQDPLSSLQGESRSGPERKAARREARPPRIRHRDFRMQLAAKACPRSGAVLC
jgi:hypothetical protein